MMFIFEIHKYRGFMATATSDRIMFTIFFITFGGLACTMPQLISSVAQGMMAKRTSEIFDAFISDLHKYGPAGLLEQLNETMRKVNEAKEAEKPAS